MIDGYGSFEAIGYGGFSTVYLAEQRIFDRRVAVKIMHADLRDPDAQRRFVRECRATGRLTGHKNIITVFDAGTTHDHRPYIAMEYFSGGALARRLKESGPLPVADAVRLTIPITDALDTAHRHGILHRDLKPANILLRGPHDPVLSDFGIASISEGTDAATASAAFTAGYAAPEVLLSENPEIASDVFALGATLFTLLCGTTPFPGKAPPQIVARILNRDIEPMRGGLPPRLTGLLGRMLDPEPTRRPGAREILAELTAVSASLPGADLPSTDLLPGNDLPGNDRLPDRDRDPADASTLVGTPPGSRPPADAPPPPLPPAPRDRPSAPGDPAAAPVSRRRRTLIAVPSLVLATAVLTTAFLLVRPTGGDPPSATPSAPASASPAPPVRHGESCTQQAKPTTDYRGRSFPSRYVCPTYVESAVYANVRAGSGDALDDSGFMRKAARVWVLCQLNGRANPIIQGNTNTWWLYTQGDSTRTNGYGYSRAWGYLPATAVSHGGQDEPIPGVPSCDGYL